MGNPEDAAAAASSSRAREDELPSYAELPGALSSGPAPRYQQPPQHGGPMGGADTALITDGDNCKGPTATNPFNFPDAPPGAVELPVYSEASSRENVQKPIAIPQITPTYKAPFLDAYAPVLLKYGIPKDTWKSFLGTVSAFLTAKVSDRMLAHAADMGKQATETPTSLLSDTVRHAMTVRKEIRRHHKRGNYLGAAFEILGGAITIPVAAAVNTAGAAMTLPTSAIGAMFLKPQTPYERAATYLAAANLKWFYNRGLHAMLLSTEEVSEMIGTAVTGLVDLARNDKRNTVEGLLQAMEGHLEKLEVQSDSRLDLGAESFWIVLVPFNYDEVVKNEENGHAQRLPKKEEGQEEEDEGTKRNWRRKGKQRLRK